MLRSVRHTLTAHTEDQGFSCANCDPVALPSEPYV